MRIGQLAETVGLPTSTIRFYEQKGLMPAADRTAKGYRKYDSQSVERLKMIKFATSLGFSAAASAAVEVLVVVETMGIYV